MKPPTECPFDCHALKQYLGDYADWIPYFEKCKACGVEGANGMQANVEHAWNQGHKLLDLFAPEAR